MRSRLAFSVLAAFACLGGCDSGMVAIPREVTKARPVEFDSARTKVDRARGRIWRLTSGGVSLQLHGERSAVVFDLPGWIVAGPVAACMPDMTLGPKGEVIVTSNVIPTLWRIDPENFAVSVHPVALEAENGRDVGFNIIEYSAPRGAFFAVSHAHGEVWKISSNLTRGEKVVAAAPSTQSNDRRSTCAIN